MPTIKQIAKSKFTRKLIKLTPIACFCLIMAIALDYSIIKTTLFVLDPTNMNKLGDITTVSISSSSAEHFEYNDRVPVEIVKAEIIKQAKQFSNDEKFMLDLAQCESSFNNLADNPKSTAKGIYQFVANTWEATESNKQHISEFDYIANIREANIKIANGEYSHWKPVCIK